MSLPRVIAVLDGSPAQAAGLVVGDEILSIDGQVPRDVIQWQLLVDEPDPEIEFQRGGLSRMADVAKSEGEPLGVEVDAALFDRVQTCDNHCPFCFIYQLPKGLRRSLYLKDDDYRLSFLYGNFTTLTRFTEADLERVITEGLSPLYVSIHSTEPELRAEMLRNKRGATSLRWLRMLLDHGVEVHGQVVVCPDVNDGPALEATLCGVLDQYPELASIAVVPLGISRYSTEPSLREHTSAEAGQVVRLVEAWQDVFNRTIGRRMVYAADEYYLLSGVEFPPAETYGEFDMHEDGIGMARAIEAEFTGASTSVVGTQAGFFSAFDGAPPDGYRAERASELGGSVSSIAVGLGPRRGAATGVLTSTYGAMVIGPLIESLECDDVRLVVVPNDYFGGNIGVTGLMVGRDIATALRSEPEGDRYLLPDVCLSSDRFLDGLTVSDLPRRVEVVQTDGVALRSAIESGR